MTTTPTNRYSSRLPLDDMDEGAVSFFVQQYFSNSVGTKNNVVAN